MEHRYSIVGIRGAEQGKKVRISSNTKPEIIEEIITKWQKLLDTVAKLIDVPSGLIMRLNENSIEVFLKNNSEENPYKVGEQEKLIYNLYCETVIGTQEKLLVPDATKSDIWKKNNPDIDLNMISYLGFPLNWPDGEVFGTVCVLDDKENHYSNSFIELLFTTKLHMEADLRLLTLNSKLTQTNDELIALNSIKTKFLSVISHDMRGSIGALSEYYNYIISNFDTYSRAELQSFFKSTSKNINSIYSTLEDLLSWSKSNLLKLSPNKSKISLNKVISELLIYFNQTLITKNIELITEFSSKNINIVADSDMISTVIRNILSNAVKYTEKDGKIYIRLFTRNQHTVMEIEDTGIGMDEKTLNSLFTYNPSSNQVSNRRETSSGIGLLLIKSFLDKHNAEVKVTSTLNQGTTFTIEFN